MPTRARSDLVGLALDTPVSILSGGQKRRLGLARLLLTDPHLLPLDEPINHLDIPASAKFEQAMTAFDGTVPALVHDRCFLRRFATQAWSLDSGTLQRRFDLQGEQEATGLWLDLRMSRGRSSSLQGMSKVRQALPPFTMASVSRVLASRCRSSILPRSSRWTRAGSGHRPRQRPPQGPSNSDDPAPFGA